MNDVTFIILGATGDLTKRKLIPAIYKLVKNNKIKKFAVIGVGRSKTTSKKILSSSSSFIKNKEKKIWNTLEKSFYYLTLDFYQKNDFLKLKDFLTEIEEKHNLSGNRLFYLATLPQHFDVITHNLNKSKIAKETKNKWARVVYEKPFGDDLKSAKKINKCIHRVFKENQVYRIDHYLGKELVENIALLRFTNSVLEPLWNRNQVESVQIILSENFGIEGRESFYDEYGALKDVVQNHMLQLVALTAMEAPEKLTGEYIRNEKAKVLKKTKVKDVLLGQYEGYTKGKGVKKNSNTETFAALHIEVDNNRWRGVPFYLKTGKYLDKKETRIDLKFKMVECLLTRSCPSDSNYLTIRIQPDEGFVLELNAKVPGKTNIVTPVTMDFCHRCLFGPNTPEAYETLLDSVIEGDQSIFVRNDEIEYSWTVIDTITKNRHKVYWYKKGSRGPKELKQWCKRHKLRWRA